MGHPTRIHAPGSSLHVIRRGNNRGAIFRDDGDRHMLLHILQRAAWASQVAVNGFALMSTHYHLVVTEQQMLSLPRMMKMVGERYVRYYNRKYDRIGTLWAGRYRAIVIEDERYWLTCLRYIEQNPWRAKIVSAPEMYEWSSCRVHALGDESDWLVPHPLYLGLGSTSEQRQTAYRAICAETLSDDELVRLRSQTRVGRVS